jgi:hypothetical protein
MVIYADVLDVIGDSHNTVSFSFEVLWTLYPKASRTTRERFSKIKFPEHQMVFRELFRLDVLTVRRLQ